MFSVNPPSATLQPGRSMALVVSLSGEREMRLNNSIKVREERD